MTPERWQQIDKLLGEALERKATERAAFLDLACAADKALRRKIEALLAAHESAESFIETPAFEVAAKALAQEARSRVGQQLGHYQVLSLLGAGGMGEVYLTLDTQLERRVALKLLPARLTRDAERLRQFVREAKAASALNHPNIITIHEMGEAGETHFIATEFIEGVTLRRRMEAEKLKLHEALDVAVQVAAALDAAHKAGIVHRDIKPENVMVRPDGLIKVLDFGLAKLAESDGLTGPTQASTRAANSTETGGLIGTPRYMSPEHARGAKLDARTDIFSLGVVLYEMITGRAPFEGETARDVIAAILETEPPPLAHHWPEAPPDLEPIVNQALRKDREERYQEVRSLLLDLKDLKQELEAKQAQTRQPDVRGVGRSSAQNLAGAVKRRKRGVAALATVALAASAIVYLAWMQKTSRTGQPPPLSIVPLTSYQGAERYPSFSPDGTQVAFSWDGEKQDNFDIYTRHIGHGAPFRLTSDPAMETSPAWSPDGRWIAFIRFLPKGKAGVFLTTPLGRSERQLTEISRPAIRVGFYGSHLAWSPDGRWIATADRISPQMPNGLVLVSIETGEKQMLTSGNDISPAFSPDGRSLAFVRILSFAVSELYLLTLADGLKPKGEPIRQTYENRMTTSPAWSSDAAEILFASGDVWVSRLYRMEASGRGTARQIEFVGEAGPVLAVSRAPHGTGHRLVYVRELFDPNIWRLQMSANGTVSPPAPLISSTRIDFNPQISPDGKKIAFESNRSGSTEIWVCNTDDLSAVQLTSFGGPLTGAVRWSPDNERIAFNSRIGGQADIYVVNARGGTPERLTYEASNDDLPSWSRDGRWIYFHSARSGSSQIWKMRSDGSAAVQVTKQGGLAALESTDGKFLYYSKSSAHGPSVSRVPVDGGEEVEVLEGVSDWSTFALTDRGIYFIPKREPTAGASIQFLSFAAGTIKEVASILKPVFVGLTISPNGQSLLYTQIDQEGSDLMLVENFR